MRKEREWNQRPAKARRFSRGVGLTYPEKIDKLNRPSEQDRFILDIRGEKQVSRFEIRDQATSLGTDVPFFTSRFSNFVSPISPSGRALEKETALAL